jgi:hypothetical protein
MSTGAGWWSWSPAKAGTEAKAITEMAANSRLVLLVFITTPQCFPSERIPGGGVARYYA